MKNESDVISIVSQAGVLIGQQAVGKKVTLRKLFDESIWKQYSFATRQDAGIKFHEHAMANTMRITDHGKNGSNTRVYSRAA